ncbi:IS3 family transposase, partial [Tsukamurella asaccharolytica]
MSDTEVRRIDLTHRVRASFEASDATYGYRRIHAELVRMGVVVCVDTVRTIMAEEGLVAVQPRLRVRT